MKIIELKSNNGSKKTSIAVGSFDGVHIAHAALIRTAAETAKRIGAVPAVWTFDDSDRKPGPQRIIMPEERTARFYEFGAERIYAFGFDEVRDLSPERFCRDILIGVCHASYAFCGYNFRFGKGACGDAALFCSLMQEYGAGAAVLDEIRYENIPVSSTAVRRALGKGDVKLAAAMLGRPFSVTLPVVHGRRLGTGLGFPTVNQNYPESLTPLRYGVYACRAYVDDKKYGAVSNVGVRPTVGTGAVTIETHIFDCDIDMYGRDVKIEFIDFMRDEKKFGTLDELKAQIALDAAAAGELICN